MVSLAALWRSWGVEPAAVVGHSQGEIAAAHVCGALSLRDATKVVALRSKALIDLIGHGGMASVAESADVVARALAPWSDTVSVAVVNGPPLPVVVSGEPDALDEFVEKMKADGVQARRISVDYASHSPHVTRVRDQVIDALSDISPPDVDAALLLHPLRQGHRHRGTDRRVLVRQPARTGPLRHVRPAAGRRRIPDVHRDEPHPVLTVPVQGDRRGTSTTRWSCHSARRDRNEVQSLVGSLAQLYVRGGTVDWDALLGPAPRRTCRRTRSSGSGSG